MKAGTHQVVVLHERALVDTLAAILALETQLVVDLASALQPRAGGGRSVACPSVMGITRTHAAAGAHDLLGVVDETAAAFAAWCSAEHC
jgi:hypothetical protein